MSLPESVKSRPPQQADGASNLQRSQAADYMTLAAISKCLQTATWLVARGNQILSEMSA